MRFPLLWVPLHGTVRLKAHLQTYQAHDKRYNRSENHRLYRPDQTLRVNPVRQGLHKFQQNPTALSLLPAGYVLYDDVTGM